MNQKRCQMCDAPIPSKRLDLMPQTNLCISCAKEMEHNARHHVEAPTRHLEPFACKVCKAPTSMKFSKRLGRLLAYCKRCQAKKKTEKQNRDLHRKTKKRMRITTFPPTKRQRSADSSKPQLPRELPGSWSFLDVPRDFMRRVEQAATHEGKTVRDFLFDIAEARVQELEGTRRKNPRKA